jgi:dihydroorotase
MHEGAVSAELGLHGYPSIGESVMVGRDLQIARYEGAPLHLCHISAAESVAEIRRAKELGVAVTAEVSPHHLCLTDELVRDLDPSVSKMSPPLRSDADRAALVEALADGTLDCIGTDHAPHRAHEKEVPFEAAPNGVIGLETAFAAVYTHLVEPGLTPLATVLERMSTGPARAFGLAAPALRVGEVANLALWDLADRWVVGPPYASRSRNCAFAGRTLQGRCTMTVAGGSVAHRLAEVAR